VATFFSGGVDSTLLQSYLNRTTTALNLTVDTAESNAAKETEYARSAAKLLGVNLRQEAVPQENFLTDLEVATQHASTPIFMCMLAVFNRAFLLNDYKFFIGGWSADALFGCAAAYNRIASLFANPFLLGCLELAAPAIARKDKANRNVLRERLEKLLPIARRLSVEPDSLLGLGARSEAYTEFDVAERLFGQDAVSRRLEQRFGYLMDRVELKAPTGNRFFRHFEIYALMDAVCGCFGPQIRHLGMASGKQAVLPFISGDVVRSALSVPVPERYLRGLEGKYLLKRLLKRRLESYPTGQRKGTTALVNFPRYFNSGPLSSIWDHYEIPDFIGGSVKDQVASSPLYITFSAISYAIWKRWVLDNQDLERLETEHSYDWPTVQTKSFEDVLSARRSHKQFPGQTEKFV